MWWRLVQPIVARLLRLAPIDAYYEELLCVLAQRMKASRVASVLLAAESLYVAPHDPTYLYVSADRITDYTSVKPILDLDRDYFGRLSKRLIRERRSLLRFERMFVLWEMAYNVRHSDAPAVEVGCYKGGSACLLASAFRHFQGVDRPMMVIDTFAGHPAAALDAVHDTFHKPGMFGDTSVEDVRNFLAPFPLLQVLQGDFLDVHEDLTHTAYSCVHLDVDTYLATKTAISYFVPRLVAGGVMIIDDFGATKCQGVTQAVNDSLEVLESCHLWQMQTEQLVVVKR